MQDTMLWIMVICDADRMLLLRTYVSQTIGDDWTLEDAVRDYDCGRPWDSEVLI